MPLIETESLILKTYNLAEADRIVLFLTEDHGVVRGVAKGAKRLKSKFGSALEPFSVVRITYFQKETLELVSIQKADLVTSYFSAAGNPDFLQKFSYLTELLIESSPPHDPNETLYRMVRACLESAGQDPARLEAIGFYFEVWLLRLTGYLPQWKTCAECRRVLDTNETASVAPGFNLVCDRCRSRSSTVRIESIHRDLMSSALRLSPSEFAQFSVDRSAQLYEVSEVLKRVISQVLGRSVVEQRPLIASNNGK